MRPTSGCKTWMTLPEIRKPSSSKRVRIGSNILLEIARGLPSMINRSPMLIVLLSLSGCCLYPYYPISPTVKLKPPNVSEIEIKPIPSAPSGQQTTTVSSRAARECEVKKAIDYANAANDEYLKAQGQHADMPGLGGLMLVPAAAAAGALAIEGEGATAITGLGAGAAAVFGLGTYLHTTARESVYNTGALGIQCLLENMAPYTQIDSDDLFMLTRTIDSRPVLTGGDYGDENTLDLTQAKTRLDFQIDQVEALGLQNNCQRLPRVMKIASLLLQAAKAADKTADMTIKAGNQFYQMALAAPSTIERTTNKINDELNGALTATEPNLSALAGNIKTLMAPQEQAVAGLSSAQNAAADAQNQTTEATSGTHGQAKGKVPAMGGTDKLSIAVNSSPKATFRASSPDQVEVLPSQSPTAQNRNPRTATAPIDTYSDLKPPGLTPEELIQLIELERSIYVVNELTSRVLGIVGSNTGTVDNTKCPILAKKAGVTTMQLNPSGDVIVSPGSDTKITISGATYPYTMPLFSRNVCNDVTATLKTGEIDVAATADTTPGYYPFFVVDGPTGTFFNVKVKAKPPADNTDEVQKCSAGKPGRPETADPGYVPPQSQGHNQQKYSCPPALVLMAAPTTTTSDSDSDH